MSVAVFSYAFSAPFARRSSRCAQHHASALTCLGIIIGVGAVIAMMEIGHGSSQSIQRSIPSMGANTLMIWPGGAFDRWDQLGHRAVRSRFDHRIAMQSPRVARGQIRLPNRSLKELSGDVRPQKLDSRQHPGQHAGVSGNSRLGHDGRWRKHQRAGRSPVPRPCASSDTPCARNCSAMSRP